MSAVAIFLLTLTSSYGRSLGQFVSARYEDNPDLELFCRFLRNNHVETTTVSTAGYTAIYPDINVRVGRLQALQQEFTKEFKIDLDKRSQTGRIIHPFEFHTLKFDPPIGIVDLRKQLKNNIVLLGLVEKLISKNPSRRVGQVRYCERPWITLKGRKTVVFEGEVNGREKGKKWSSEFLQDS